MYWADKLVKTIPDKKAKHRVDDMKTVSGMPHVGSLRAVCTHDIVYRAMLDAGFDVDFTYVFNDMDPMDGLPVYLDEKKYQQYMGKPLYKIPSPVKGYESFGKYYATLYTKAFNKIACKPKIIWSHEVYASGKMDQTIRMALDNADKIRKIYKKVADQTKPRNWHPYQVICEQCGKVGTTIVIAWDGTYVTYECRPDLVKWAKGCGHRGEIKPVKENGKLMWKPDWAAHWKVVGVTIEGAGKEHFTKGGSHDVADYICEEIFKYKTPFGFLHEFFLVGGAKMSSSKGTGIGADKITEIIPAKIVRFLIVRTPLRRATDFNPQGLTIPDLFDDYDRCAREYFKKGIKSDYGRIWQLSQVEPIPKHEPFFPRFRDVANYMQNPSVDIYKKFDEIKGSILNEIERKILDERIKYAKIWLKSYAPKETVLQLSKEIPSEAAELSVEQKKYLLQAIALIQEKSWQPEELQQELYELAKKQKIPARRAFQAVYLALIGKKYGPKAGWLLAKQDKDFIAKRFNEVQSFVIKKVKEKFIYKVLSDKNLFTINPKFKKSYPSTIVGLAIIKGVNIKKDNSALQREIQKFVRSQSMLNAKDVGEYPEIKSYRRIYKETGVDWHSKRPSPEALLRRIAQKKDLYTINTCVDAYNLVVMKYRVSAGAFDYDKIKFPTTLRFAKKGDKITTLGEDKPTFYKEGDVAYFDQQGGYNIYFNYLDAERTAITEDTKNLWINVDGIYNISRSQVERTLQEVIEKICKYCGGKLELAGIVP